MGHRRIVYLGPVGPAPGGYRHPHCSADRLQAYRRAMEAAGLPPRPVHDTSMWGNMFVVESWDEAMARRPTALLTYTNALAVRAHTTARAAGLRVPEDLSIAAFLDDVSELGDRMPFAVPGGRVFAFALGRGMFTSTDGSAFVEDTAFNALLAGRPQVSWLSAADDGTVVAAAGTALLRFDPATPAPLSRSSGSLSTRQPRTRRSAGRATRRTCRSRSGGCVAGESARTRHQPAAPSPHDPRAAGHSDGEKPSGVPLPLPRGEGAEAAACDPSAVRIRPDWATIRTGPRRVRRCRRGARRRAGPVP